MAGPPALSTSKPALFSPIRVGKCSLKHRVVLAPLTRIRATIDGIPQNPVMKEYYSQRASVPDTLLITEATLIAAKAGVWKNAPGIWSDEQTTAWKEIVDAVHAKKAYIYLQLWALGRAADVEGLREINPSLPFVSASDIPISSKPDNRPRPLSKEEIKDYISLYATAASNAVHKAGFDGVEIHGANGYLIDQFTQSVSNHRSDEYGGSVENRCRFALEVIDAVVEAAGEDRTGIRIGPWTPFQDMGMPDPHPTFTHLVTQIKERYPHFAYIHVIEAQVAGDTTIESEDKSNDFIRDIWHPRPLINAGNYTREKALERAEQREGQLVAFGRLFLANPDLPKRLEKDIPLNKPDRATFYVAGDTSGKGYTDYPFAEGPVIEDVLT